MIQVLIADDHGMLRDGLRTLLEREDDISVVAESENGREALDLIAEMLPDVAVLDLNMPEPDGLEVVRQVARSAPDVKTIVLTASEEAAIARECLAVGAAGYVIKRAAVMDLVSAVRSVFQGGLYLHSAVASGVVNPPKDPPFVEFLTPRETQVLRLIALGYTNPQMAERLCLSVRTIESHRAKLSGKIGTKDRIDLVRYAQERGMFLVED